MTNTGESMNDTKELRGPELLRVAVNTIIANPQSFDQSVWHSLCGTKHCIAGHCQIIGGRPLNNATAKLDAKTLLGISREDADWLFAGQRTLNEIHSFAYALLRPEEFDRDGYDRAGYDRAGRDRDGRDRDGYDRDGRDRDGRDRAGSRLQPL